jgi:hypothetical protein
MVYWRRVLWIVSDDADLKFAVIDGVNGSGVITVENDHTFGLRQTHRGVEVWRLPESGESTELFDNQGNLCPIDKPAVISTRINVLGLHQFKKGIITAQAS